MKILDRIIDNISEEIEGAKDYAEKYIESKALGDMSRANVYREMAQDELRHAEHIRDFAISDIDGMKKVYSFTQDEEEKWDHHLKHFVDCMGWVKRMLS